VSVLLSAAAAAGPLAAGWSVHTLWMRRRIEAARRDPLTGLLGRDAFEQRARRGLAGGGPCAVLVIDLDGFKALNDTAGHAAGDAALHTVGSRLMVWNRGRCGVVARLGGDEFAAALPASGPAELRRELERLHTALCQPVPYEGRPLALGASIGAVWHDGRTPADLAALLRRADEAMYAAKQTGGGAFLPDTSTPAHPTVNGRRAGRPGTHLTGEGGAR
jgi:diguanylate cyclase (GGDEF)-like protein